MPQLSPVSHCDSGAVARIPCRALVVSNEQLPVNSAVRMHSCLQTHITEIVSGATLAGSYRLTLTGSYRLT